MKKSALVLAATLVSSSVFAAPLNSVPVNSAGFYGGASIGYADSSSGWDTGWGDPFGGSFEENGALYNLHAGYMLNQYFGVELGYTKYPDSVDTNTSYGLNYKITTNYDAVIIALKGAYHFKGITWWSLYGKLGAAELLTDTSASVPITSTGSNQALVPYVELGSGFDIAPHLTINVGLSAAIGSDPNTTTYPIPSAKAGAVGHLTAYYAGIDYHF